MSRESGIITVVDRVIFPKDNHITPRTRSFCLDALCTSKPPTKPFFPPEVTQCYLHAWIRFLIALFRLKVHNTMAIFVKIIQKSVYVFSETENNQLDAIQIILKDILFTVLLKM